jgi:hypothetical protein
VQLTSCLVFGHWVSYYQDKGNPEILDRNCLQTITVSVLSQEKRTALIVVLQLVGWLGSEQPFTPKMFHATQRLEDGRLIRSNPSS